MPHPQEQRPTLTELERTLAVACMELIDQVAPRHPTLQPLLERVRVQLERVT